jgi:hypothetical protein
MELDSQHNETFSQASSQRKKDPVRVSSSTGFYARAVNVNVHRQYMENGILSWRTVRKTSIVANTRSSAAAQMFLRAVYLQPSVPKPSASHIGHVSSCSLFEDSVYIELSLSRQPVKPVLVISRP